MTEQPISRSGPVLSAAVAAAVSPELAALLAECEAAHAEIFALPDNDYGTPEMRDGTRLLRTRLAGFPVAGIADVQAKAALLGRLWDLPTLRLETAEMIERADVGLDELALCIVCDLIGLGESEPCA